MNTSFFYFHHSTIIIVSSIHVYKWFFTVWVDCDIHFHSFISIKSLFLNYEIVFILLVFHSIAIKKGFSIRLTFIIQNLNNILKYIMQCLRQALSEPTTLQPPIKLSFQKFIMDQHWYNRLCGSWTGCSFHTDKINTMYTELCQFVYIYSRVQ